MQVNAAGQMSSGNGPAGRPGRQLQQQQAAAVVYTHQLPYGVRQQICNLCDADQSWRLLGGQFMRLDATQLRLVGQATLRNDSPTGELLNKLDSANVRVAELANYLAGMGHWRATDLLRPYVIDANAASHAPAPNGAGAGQTNQGQQLQASLATPTPSFSSIQPMAIMSSSEFELIAPADYQDQNPDEWQFVEAAAPVPQRPPPRRCHNEAAGAHLLKPNHLNINNNNNNHNNSAQVANSSASSAAQDPGAEIVRLACANNRKRTSISDQEVVNQLRLIMQITYNELKVASDDFSSANILGNGGFASVYRGHWKGTDVAIKRLRCNLMDQALNELTILNSYRIDNILPIYGISIDGPEACLVYQFMANGSLEDRLSCKNQSEPLGWQQRALIAEGVAKGLYYLHTLREKPLVHGDAKSANVLLDAQFVPKLGDFGLARQVFKGQNAQTEHHTHCTVSSIHGTSVYLPPEYLRHKILSPAVDVYSYGVVLLELATGKRAYDGKRLLIDFVEDELKQQQQQQQPNSSSVNFNLKDQRLQGESQAELRVCFELLLRLGANCAHRIKKKRPDMGQVLGHFAQFRLSAATVGPQHHPLPRIDCLIAGANAAPGSQATTRTLTPELAPVASGNGRLRLAQPPFDSQNLMSVEEEGDLLLLQQHQELASPAAAAAHNRQLDQMAACSGQQAAADNQIEAMIPLLTELGFSPQLGDQQELAATATAAAAAANN